MLVHLNHLLLSSATLSGGIFCGSFWSKNLCYLCAYHIGRTHFIPQPHEQESCRRQTQCSSTLCESLCTWLIWWCPLQPCQMRYFVVHFDQKSCCFCAYRTTLAKHILFLNHRTKKVVGGKHNVLIHYADSSAPYPSAVVLCNTFKWDILLCVHIHDKSLKMCAVCEPTLWDTSRLLRLRNITICVAI